MFVEKNNLKSALGKISVFVSKGANGAGSKILFTAKEGKASITACDGSSIGVFSFPVSDTSEMAVVAEYKAFVSAASLRGDVNLEFKDGELKVTQGETTMVFAASGRDTFAFEEKKIEDGGSIKIDSSVLKKLVGKVSYARKEKDSRPFVTGVNLTFDGSKLKTESTDALRMLRNYTTIEGSSDGQFSGVLSPKCIKAIESMDEGKEITLSMNDNAISFLSEDMKVYMPKLNCPYPDTTRFFVMDEKATFVLDRSKVLESMKILTISESKALLCKKDGCHILFSMQDGVSDVKDKIETENAYGENFEFCIDFEIFRDIFRNLRDGNKVTFSWKDPISTVLFKDEENLEGIVKPLKK